MKHNGVIPASSESDKSKLLSICMTGRDDDYMLDFTYRITTTLNYIARNLKQLGRLGDVELLVTDWGSEIPLAQSLSVTPEAAHICRFVYVPPSVVRAVQNGGNGFHISLAVNTGSRRACGKFLMMAAADTLIPQHSLEAILRLSDGKLDLPIAVDSTYFLLSRQYVPWQFVHRQPNLGEWDHYLLVNASRLEPEKNWKALCVGEAAGALMMHQSLWHLFRGLDERLAGWGGNDFNLAMRVTQNYPWAELSSIGVTVYKMEHSPFGRRAKLERVIEAEERRLYISPTAQVNDQDWGLGAYPLEIQKAQNICSPSPAARSEEPAVPLASWNQSRQELLAELTSPEVRNHVRRIVDFFFRRHWSVDPGEVNALFFLAWYSLYHHPRRYLEFGIKRSYAATVVAAARKDAEIYGVESWEGLPKRWPPYFVVQALYEPPFGYCGYSRFINGDMRTAVQRLRSSFIGPFFLDLVLVRGDLLRADVVNQVSELLSNLEMRGALVFTCKSAEHFALVWDEIRKRFPQFTYLRCKDHRTGLILAAALDDDRRSTVDEDCLFKTGWMWLSLAKYQSIRLFRALRRPRMYPEYAVQVYRWLRETVGSTPPKVWMIAGRPVNDVESGGNSESNAGSPDHLL